MNDCSNILLVEDDRSDVFLFRRAMAKAGIAASFAHTSDGDEAIRYLKGEEPFTNRIKYPLPSLLVTDLKMPRVSGFELLAWIRDEIQPRTFPIIVLSGSNLPADRDRAFELGADDYWIKSAETEILVRLLTGLKIAPDSPSARVILLVDDSPDEAFLLKRACRCLDPPVEIVHLSDGPLALQYLLGREPFTDPARNPSPDLILLDLNLHGMGGLELLRQIRATPGYATLPVVIFTGAPLADAETRPVGANACEIKPFTVDALTATMSRLYKQFLS